MCGLSGVAGDIRKDDVDAFFDLMIFNQVRGMHSTGIARMADKGARDITVLKAATDANRLMCHKDISDYMSTATHVLMGHNRFATIGDITYGNAHPFMVGQNFVGCHNGTIGNKWEFPKECHFPTDSESAMHMIAGEGPDAISKMRGAYAFVWVDKRGEVPTLNFIRNKDRPMCFAFEKGGRCIYWSSEPLILKAALERNRISYDTILATSEDIWYAFPLPMNNISFDLKVARRRKIEEKKWANTWKDSRAAAYAGWEGEDDLPFEMGRPGNIQEIKREIQMLPPVPPKSHVHSKNIEPTKLLPAPPIPPISIVQSTRKKRKPYVGFGGKVLDEKQFKRATRFGCSFCTNKIEWGDTVRFITEKECICENCMKDSEISHLVKEA